MTTLHLPAPGITENDWGEATPEPHRDAEHVSATAPRERGRRRRRPRERWTAERPDLSEPVMGRYDAGALHAANVGSARFSASFTDGRPTPPATPGDHEPKRAPGPCASSSTAPLDDDVGTGERSFVPRLARPAPNPRRSPVEQRNHEHWRAVAKRIVDQAEASRRASYGSMGGRIDPGVGWFRRRADGSPIVQFVDTVPDTGQTVVGGVDGRWVTSYHNGLRTPVVESPFAHRRPRALRAVGRYPVMPPGWKPGQSPRWGRPYAGCAPARGDTSGSVAVDIRPIMRTCRARAPIDWSEGGSGPVDRGRAVSSDTEPIALVARSTGFGQDVPCSGEPVVGATERESALGELMREPVGGVGFADGAGSVGSSEPSTDQTADGFDPIHSRSNVDDDSVGRAHLPRWNALRRFLLWLCGPRLSSRPYWWAKKCRECRDDWPCRPLVGRLHAEYRTVSDADITARDAALHQLSHCHRSRRRGG
ncbi:hypothetical protein [Stackebrandtia soli]|uniref:hypothetical protein n=1 Tax=Stackebrandtia soli TaxID=1892856 RepID=UPI0039ED3A77